MMTRYHCAHFFSSCLHLPWHATWRPGRCLTRPPCRITTATATLANIQIISATAEAAATHSNNDDEWMMMMSIGMPRTCKNLIICMRKVNINKNNIEKSNYEADASRTPAGWPRQNCKFIVVVADDAAFCVLVVVGHPARPWLTLEHPNHAINLINLAAAFCSNLCRVSAATN